MIDWLPLLWILPVGMLFGFFYFGGLWLTVNQLTDSRYPALLILLSFVLRSVLTLAGFYLVMANRWERVIVLVVGFLLARFITVRYWGHAPQRRG